MGRLGWSGMQEPGQVERLWWPRLRWRMRGAWQWPAFALLTVADALLLLELPYYEEGPGHLVGALLLAGFANLVAVAVLAPRAGRLVRRARPDLPRLIATDSAGTVLLGAIFLALLVGGLVHRPAVAAEHRDERAAALAAHEWVARHEPGWSGRLAQLDVMRVESDLYRACVPGPDPRRWLCVFVTTDRRPAGVRRDLDQAGNGAYRVHGGFR
jgi:hypothetical protein